jgi:hypothetical protein
VQVLRQYKINIFKTLILIVMACHVNLCILAKEHSAQGIDDCNNHNENEVMRMKLTTIVS